MVVNSPVIIAIGISHTPGEQAKGAMHGAVVANGDAERIVASKQGVNHAIRIVFKSNGVKGIAFSVGYGVGGNKLLFPSLTVVVGDHVEHFGGVGAKHHSHIVAVGGHHVVVGGKRVAVVAFIGVVDAGEVNHITPGLSTVGGTHIVNVVVVRSGVANLIGKHDMDVLVIGTAADHSRPGGIGEVGKEFPFAFALGGTVVHIGAAGV